MGDGSIRIRRAKGLEDYEACIALQKEVWGFSEVEDFAPIPLLIVANRYGGSVLVAQQPAGPIVGFAYALPCLSLEGTPFWWSHMTAVAQTHQGTGIGFRLKVHQRAEALDAGIQEIWWTFDPLQSMNAHFNARKLGALGVRYEENLYGRSSSPLHHGFPTDRLLVKWHLQSAHVVDRVGPDPPVILRDFDGLVHILPNAGNEPGQPQLGHTETPLLLEIPKDFSALRSQEPKNAAKWREVLSVIFPHYLDRGYVVIDFMVVERPRPQTFYVLEKPLGPIESRGPGNPPSKSL